MIIALEFEFKLKIKQSAGNGIRTREGLPH